MTCPPASTAAPQGIRQHVLPFADPVMKEIAQLYIDLDTFEGEFGACTCQYSVPADSEALRWFVLVSVVCIFAAIYLGQVFPGEHGRAQPFYFIFLPHYWLPGILSGSKESAEALLAKRGVRSGEVDGDVAAEEKLIKEGKRDKCPVLVASLGKTFKTMNPVCRKPPFRAVDGLTLSMEKGKCNHEC